MYYITHHSLPSKTVGELARELAAKHGKEHDRQEGDWIHRTSSYRQGRLRIEYERTLRYEGPLFAELRDEDLRILHDFDVVYRERDQKQVPVEKKGVDWVGKLYGIARDW